MKRTRYPLPPRANLSAGFWGCQFCKGSGCLACDGESNRQYKEQFPDGPKPILVIEAAYQPELATMQDDGCPHVDAPAAFPIPTGNDVVSSVTRGVLEILGAFQGASR